MTEKLRKKCPTCMGEKIIPGVCESNVEWRGTEGDGDAMDSHCTPDEECPTCLGKGFIEE